MPKIRNKATGEIKIVGEAELSKYGITQRSSVEEKPSFLRRLVGTVIPPVGLATDPRARKLLGGMLPRTKRYATETVPEYYKKGYQGYGEQLRETARIAPEALAAAGEIAPWMIGGFKPTKPGFIPKVVAGAKTGAVLGGMYGATEVGTPKERWERGKRGAITGGIIGGAIPFVEKGVEVTKKGVRKLGEKFMNIFLKSEHGKDVIKYVPNIHKAKNLDDATKMIKKAKTELGKQLEVKAGIVKPPKKQILSGLKKLRKKYVGVDDAAVKTVDKVIKKVNTWKPQKFQTLQTKKQILAELGASAYRTGKSAKAKAYREAADVVRPFLEKVATEKGVNIREINRVYNVLREAEKSAIRASKTAAKSPAIDYLIDLGLPITFGPKGFVIAGARRLLKSPKGQQKISQFLIKLGQSGVDVTGKSLTEILTRIGVMGGVKITESKKK